MKTLIAMLSGIFIAVLARVFFDWLYHDKFEVACALATFTIIYIVFRDVMSTKL